MRATFPEAALTYGPTTLRQLLKSTRHMAIKYASSNWIGREMKHKHRHKKYIVGVSAHFHDSAACLLEDGVVVAAASEERFSRLKHDASFPIRSIDYCLRKAAIGPDDVDQYVFYENPFEKARRILWMIEDSAEHVTKSLLQPFSQFILQKLDIPAIFARHLYETYGVHIEQNRIHCVEHHASHAASAFFPSGFQDAAVLCVDGVGEFDTVTSWNGGGSSLEKLESIAYPNSLGLLYSAFTSFLGFLPNSGEYKVMGLAPYGSPRFAGTLREAFSSGSGFEFRINPDVSDSLHLDKRNHLKIANLLGREARKPDSEIESFHCDVAASIQKILNEEMVSLSVETRDKVDSENLCLAGGVALNCVGVSAIRDEGSFKNVWVQPASTDSGGAIGAALSFYHLEDGPPNRAGVMNPYLGPKIRNKLAETVLESEGLVGLWLDDDQMAKLLAKRLAKGSVVAVAKGRMEFGPRALGNRSMLADPRNYAVKKHLNSIVKERESFRPFAPVVLYEKAHDWFYDIYDSPFMSFTFRAKRSDQASVHMAEFDRTFSIDGAFPAATHVDQTCRVQTVKKEQNDFLWRVLVEFEKITGLPVLLNTSFNGKNEPIVCSEIDAVRCFRDHRIDSLCLGNWFVGCDRLAKMERGE